MTSVSSTLSPPVILGNAPSSGSSLLTNLIGRSPAIYQRNELALFDKGDWLRASAAEFQSEWQSWFRSGYRRRLACEMRVAFTNFDSPPPSPEPVEGYLDYIVRLMDRLADGEGARLWIEKTPANIFAFATLLEKMPDARFVAIHRDARAVIASLLRRGFSAPLAVARWYLPNLAAFGLQDNSRVHQLRYEDLVIDQDAALRALFGFIGEDLQPGEDATTTKSDQILVGTWRASPLEPVSTAGLWTEGDSLPDNAASAFRRIHPSQAFLRSIGIESAPSASELQQHLGYSLTGFGDIGLERSLLRDRARDILAYAGGCIRHGLIPRPVPFYFD